VLVDNFVDKGGKTRFSLWGATPGPPHKLPSKSKINDLNQQLEKITLLFLKYWKRREQFPKIVNK
jgi:hypothetical protein